MKKVFAVFMLALVTPIIHANESVQSPDALESEMTACLIKNTKNSKCLEKVLGNKILPGNEKLISVAAQMDDILKKWLGDESIYAVHPLRSKKTGAIYERRSYLIEDTSGALMTLNFSTLKRLGKWYVWEFNVNSTQDKIEAALKAE